MPLLLPGGKPWALKVAAISLAMVLVAAVSVAEVPMVVVPLAAVPVAEVSLAVVSWLFLQSVEGVNVTSKQNACCAPTRACGLSSLPPVDSLQAPRSVKWSGSQRPALVMPTSRAATETGTSRRCSARGEARAGARMPRARRCRGLGGRTQRCLVVRLPSRASCWGLLRSYDFVSPGHPLRDVTETLEFQFKLTLLNAITVILGYSDRVTRPRTEFTELITI